MKTLSKMLRSTILFLNFLLTGAVLAASVSEVYQANRTAILTKKATIINETAFLVGRTTTTSNQVSQSIGFSKAKNIALGNLDWLQFSQARFPTEVSPNARAAVWQIYRMLHPLNLNLEHIEPIDSLYEPPNKYTVVLAVPKIHAQLSLVTINELLPAFHHYREVLQGLKAELAPPPSPASFPIQHTEKRCPKCEKL